VTSDFDPGALMARWYAVPGGPRVCLRIPRVRDRDGIRRLVLTHGPVGAELELARLGHFDPRRQLVICATALLGSAETVVGIGAIELRAGEADEPSLIVVDGGAAGLKPLLRDALVGRARALGRARAA
jgi:hypothetical protein